MARPRWSGIFTQALNCHEKKFAGLHCSISTSLSKAKILMRRQHDTGFGRWFWNLQSMSLETNQQLKTWLNWIQNGGTYDQTQSKLPWKPCLRPGRSTNHWWINKLQSMSTLLGNSLDELTDETKAAHLTFLGPKVAERYWWWAEAACRNSWRTWATLWVSGLTIQRRAKVEITWIWKILGCPFIWELWYYTCVMLMARFFKHNNLIVVCLGASRSNNWT